VAVGRGAPRPARDHGAEITYVEEGRIVEKNLPARASFFLKRLGERKTYLVGLETIKTLCEKPQA